MSSNQKRKHKATSSVEVTADDGDDDDEQASAQEDTQSTDSKRARHSHNVQEDDTFRFMDLPGELRNKIYDLVLCSPTGEMWMGHQMSRQSGRKRAIFSHTANMGPREYRQHQRTAITNIGVLQVNQQVHHEAMSVVYGQKFNFQSADALQAFLLRLKTSTVALLRHVNIEGPIPIFVWKSLPPVFALLRPAVNSLVYLGVKDMKSIQFKALNDEMLEKVSRIDRQRGVEHCMVTTDGLVGQYIAKEIYTHMHPYVEVAVRNKGAQHTLSILHVFEDLFEQGPVGKDYGPIKIWGAPIPNGLTLSWVDRKKVFLTAVEMELARLVADDAAPPS